MYKKLLQHLALPLSRISSIDQTYRKYNLSKAKKILSKIDSENLTHFLIQGSVARNSVKFPISDLDIICVVKKKELFEKQIQQNITSGLVPVDLDIYSVEEFDFLLKFGGYRFYEEKLISLKGDVNFNYYFIPLKFYFDITVEIFKKIEWLNIFLKKDNYLNQAKINHLYHNINLLLSELEIREISIKSKGRKGYIEFLTKLEEKLLNQNSFQAILNLKYSIIESYTVNEDGNVKVIKFSDNKSITISKDCQKFNFNEYLNLTPRLYEIFKSTGCFSLDYLLRFSENTRNKLGASFIELSAYSRYIQGEYSWVLDVERNVKRGDVLNNEDLIRLANNVESSFPRIDKKLITEDKSYFVNCFWGSSNHRNKAFQKVKSKLREQEAPVKQFMIKLLFNGEPYIKVEDDYVELALRGNESHFELWHKESLFNIAGFFLLGADCIIFSDADVYSNDKKWLQKIIDKSKIVDFVQGFGVVVDTKDSSYRAESWTKKYKVGEKYFRAPGLIWATSYLQLVKIDGLPDDFPEGSGDGALVRELTGVKLSFIDEAKWFTSKIRNYFGKYSFDYVDIEVIHINHGSARDYVNRSIFLDLINFKLERVVDKDYLGLLSWKTDNYYLRAPFKLKDYIFEYDKDRFIFLINELYEKDILKVPLDKKYIFFSKSPHMHDISLTKGGVGFIFDKGNELNFFLPDNNNDEVPYDFSLTGMTVNYDHAFYSFDVPKNNQFEGIELYINYLREFFELNIYFDKLLHLEIVEKITVNLTNCKGRPFSIVIGGIAQKGSDWYSSLDSREVGLTDLKHVDTVDVPYNKLSSFDFDEGLYKVHLKGKIPEDLSLSVFSMIGTNLNLSLMKKGEDKFGYFWLSKKTKIFLSSDIDVKNLTTLSFVLERCNSLEIGYELEV